MKVNGSTKTKMDLETTVLDSLATNAPELQVLKMVREEMDVHRRLSIRTVTVSKIQMTTVVKHHKEHRLMRTAVNWILTETESQIHWTTVLKRLLTVQWTMQDVRL